MKHWMVMHMFDFLENWLNKPKLIDFYYLFSQIHMMLLSGYNIQNSLQEISANTPNKILSNSLVKIYKSLYSGITASAAIEREKIFPRITAPTVAAGEKAGNPANAFLKLSELIWLQHNLYSKVKNALLIPKLAIIMMTLMIIIYIKLAIPEYIKLYSESGIDLPKAISVASLVVNFLVDYWYFTILEIWGLKKLWDVFRKINAHFIDKMKLKIPIYKQLHFNFLQHQFVSIISLMLSNGLVLTDALEHAAAVVDNTVMKEAIVRTRNDILKGYDLSRALNNNNKNHVFDNIVVSLMTVGQKSDQMVLALNNAAAYYERQLNNSIEPVSTKITFLTMIPLGMLIVGIFVFTMTPMFSYMDSINGLR